MTFEPVMTGHLIELVTRGRMRTLASVLFPIDSLIIGLGAFGHGLQSRHVHEVVDPLPVPVRRNTGLGLGAPAIRRHGPMVRCGANRVALRRYQRVRCLAAIRSWPSSSRSELCFSPQDRFWFDPQEFASESARCRAWIAPHGGLLRPFEFGTKVVEEKPAREGGAVPA